VETVYAPSPARVVVVGASAGGVEALGQLLPGLRPGFPWPVLAVVHLPSRSPSLLVSVFAPRCALPVYEAEDKLPIEVGAVYFAPPDYHLLVERRDAMALSVDPPIQFSRPAIDVLFQSAARAFGADTVGIVLSGANDDGAAGLREIAAAGGRAWVQDHASATAPQMPLAALRAVPAARVMSASAMAHELGLLVDAER
jgi:two-component system, chemotaxis family, protein-glutamate methylesterase/glutaminase